MEEIRMNIFDMINKIKSQNGKPDFVSLVEELADIFEYEKVELDDVVTGVNELITITLKQSDEVVKESCLHALLTAATYQDIAEIVNWDELYSSIKNFNDECVGYIITILGFSRNEKYKSLIEDYTKHPNDDIKETAEEALLEYSFFSSKNCPSTNQTPGDSQGDLKK